MQSKLPDINNALVTHRLAALRAYDRGDLQKAIIELRSMIALLPQDYRLRIDTEEYRTAKRAARKFKCGQCDEETDLNQITLTTLDHSAEYVILLKKPTYEIWQCPSCKADNNVSDTKSILERNPDPCYLGVIPEPPRKYSIFDRPGYDFSWKQWIEISFPELENKISLYRTDYVADNADQVIEDSQEEYEDADE